MRFPTCGPKKVRRVLATAPDPSAQLAGSGWCRPDRDRRPRFSPAAAERSRSVRRLRVPAEDREMLRLAVPALAALVSEPLFLLADTAVVGHLGTTPLVALAVAAIVVQTL